MSDVERVVAHCDTCLDLEVRTTAEEYGYRHLPLCLIDAVYSINARYEGVQNVIRRYCARVGLRSPYYDPEPKAPVHAEPEHTICDFLRVVAPYAPDEIAEHVFDNRARTSPRSGILKAEAVVMFAKVLQTCRIDTMADMRGTSRQRELELRVTQIPGQSSGLSLKYFYMLCGADHLVKPDRMIFRFLENAIGHSVTSDEAQHLLSCATLRLQERYAGLTPRELDGCIWRYQRQQDST